MREIKIDQFEGPLDLLLQLIEGEKLDIAQISLATVTDQYLACLDRADLKPEDLADFLVIAAKLLLIKSKALLPGVVEDEAAGAELETQLKLYKEFLEASKVINKMILQRRFAYSREKLPSGIAPEFAPPPRLTAGKMRDIFMDVLKKIEPVVKLPEKKLEKVVSLEERIKNIREMIYNKAILNFREMLGGSRGRTDVIVNFLAVLELVKQRVVTVDQGELFEEIVIKKV